MPHSYDQPYWGQVVANMGLGPEPIPRKRLSAENLSPAIEKAILDQNIRRKAEIIGKRVREEDGIGCAIDLIYRYANAFQRRTPDRR